MSTPSSDRERALEVAIATLNAVTKERHEVGAGLLEARAVADLLLRWGAAAREQGAREMRERAAEASDNEPELPGEPPRAVLDAFISTRDPVPLLRLAVKVTKECISKRIRALPLTGESAPQPEPREGDVWMVPMECTATGTCCRFTRGEGSAETSIWVQLDWIRANGRLLRRKGGA